MAKVLVSDQYLTNIANAIREKNVSVSYDGTTVRNETHGVSGSLMIGYTFTNCTWSYSNGSLTITSPSSGANGYFKDSMLHRLIYIYEE